MLAVERIQQVIERDGGGGGVMDEEVYEDCMEGMIMGMTPPYSGYGERQGVKMPYPMRRRPRVYKDGRKNCLEDQKMKPEDEEASENENMDTYTPPSYEMEPPPSSKYSAKYSLSRNHNEVTTLSNGKFVDVLPYYHFRKGLRPSPLPMKV